MRSVLCFVAVLLLGAMRVTAAEHEVVVSASWGDISASLSLPDKATDTAMLIVAGSGPTDRNGNSSLSLKTYAYAMLAEQLTEQGYAVMRYDKRGVGLSTIREQMERALVFDDYVDDAELCVEYLRGEGYDRIVIVGHSEGGDIALHLAERGKVDALVLLCAAGYSIDTILMRQLSAQLVPSHLGLMSSATSILQSLKRGNTIPEERIPKELISLFHPSVQPYLISCMQDDPCAMIAALQMPILIVTGGRDVQISVDNGEALHRAQPAAKHITFENMSHVLKDASSADRVEQLTSVYINSQQPLTEGLVESIAEFIN